MRHGFIDVLDRLRDLAEPRSIKSVMRTAPYIASGLEFARDWHANVSNNHGDSGVTIADEGKNPLRAYFDSHTTGRGIWKWNHYFEIYHRHFEKFVGREVSIVEIGIYSGGSLEMWKNYFGPRCKVYGVDIESACKAYEGNDVRIFIGDQADRSFWRRFKESVPSVDILIDDGGHTPEQQIVTLEEMLPHLRPGGIYLCEDIHGIHHDFAAYVSGLTSHLHTQVPIPGPVLAAAPTEFQQAISSIHFYPFVAVIQRTDTPFPQFAGPKHGTEWQPFL